MLKSTSIVAAVVAAFVLTSCGRAHVAGGDTPIVSDDPSRSADAQAAPPLVEGGVLDDEAAQVLAALQVPSEEAVARRAGFRQISVGDWLVPLECSQLAEWLEIPVPDLTKRVTPGADLVCGTDWTSGELPVRGIDVLPNGDPVEVTAVAIAVPPSVDLKVTAFDAVAANGGSTISFYSGPSIWDSTPPKTDISKTSGGSSAFNYRGVKVGVQNLGPAGTRLAWVKNTQNDLFNVELRIGMEPLLAAQGLVKTADLP